jgi:hypothetical protein
MMSMTPSERQQLSAAFRPGVDAGAAQANRAIAGQLLPHYVSGTVRQLEADRCHLDAPLEDLVIQEAFTFDAATDVHSLYGPELSAIPVGSRVQVGTPAALRNADGSRHAAWVNVNGIYSHGDVITVDDEKTITLQQAHGGSVRTLLVDETSTLNTTNGDLSDIEPGSHLFFTGLAETAELGCPRIHLVVLNHTS